MNARKFDLKKMLLEVAREDPPKTTTKPADLSQSDINRMINERTGKSTKS